MSFGGSGGFGGFGSNNNNTTSGFGGFGSSSTNNNTGFGSNTTGGGFGSSNNTGGSLFGGGNTASSGFGGFGTNNTKTTFGATPFGSSTTTGGGLFGGGGAASGSGGFGGFGSAANNTTTTSGFGGSTTGGGLFGQAKPAFGSSTTTGTGGLFGGGGSSGGFGSTAAQPATGGFGSTTSAFGAAATPAQNNGTASVPFNAKIEKDGTSQTQHFQTISFQEPYTHYSLEELRLADYAQGRRYGNQNGQAGAFGQSTGFGGFGSTATNTTGTGFGSTANTGGGLFGGSGTTTNTGFGQTNTTAGFGGSTNTGGGLFGQNKPGGVFGAAAPATTQPSTGLFGSSTTTTTPAFGAGATASTGFGSTNAGGGLFGSQNNTQAAKPAFGGFGSGTANTTSGFGSTGTTGFGQTNTTTTGGSLFGQNNPTSAAPAFGSTQTTTNTGSNLFGGGGGGFGQTAQTQNTAQTGGSLFGGGFGQNQQNQQKPGGLFGSSTTANTGTSLFGGGQQNNQTQPSGGLFGNANNNNQTQGTSLFGNKPATTGTSLFGNNSTPTTNTSGGGLFGNLNNNNQQSNQGTSLFGGQQNQQKPGSLFSSSTTANTNTGGGLFGNLGNNNNNTSTLGGGSLFGSQNQSQQNQQPQSNSLFGASGSSVLQTSINVNPYGNDQLFAGLNQSTSSPGPLATPLTSSQKTRKSAILPQHKLNPSASTRLLTPQKKFGGYGFSYSTYGTPNSASSSYSPSFTSSFPAGGSIGRQLGKSMSTSNLRNSFTPETSILAPGAFSTTGRSFATGSMKKLNVNRAINARTPLFGNEHDTPTQSTIKKTVSFDRTITGNDESEANGASSTALVRTETEDVSPGRSSPAANSSPVNGTASRPEMQEMNGNNPASLPENGAPLRATSESSLNAQKPKGDKGVDPQPGDYYMRPSLNELRQMNRQQLKTVSGFTVGRQNIGQIEFNKGNPVDLSAIDLDKIMGDIVVLTPRNATVFGEACTVTKPTVGNGLNVPSRITLENSWPRASKRGSKANPSASAGLSYQKHIERLKRVQGTTFEAYNSETGEWSFTVEHFSSYGLDDDDDDDDEDEYMESSLLSAAPDTPTQYRSSQMTGTPQEDSMLSPTQSSPDDTFDFKKGKRSQASLPGGFEDGTVYEDEEMDETMGTNNTEQSFLGERSAGSLDTDDYTEESESESVEDQDMAGSVSGPVQTVEQPAANPFNESLQPKSILKASQPYRRGPGTPTRGQFEFEDDWADQLQRTISPKKQNREALRQSQGDVLKERDGNLQKLAQSLGGQTIATSIDLMKSLFGETEKQGRASVAKQTGIKLPYAKRPKTSNDLDAMSGSDKDFHWCNKPHFSEDGTLVYPNASPNSLELGVFSTSQQPIVTAHKDIRFTKLPTFPDAIPQTLIGQKEKTEISTSSDVPFATTSPDFDFDEYSEMVAIDNPAGIHEQKAWELLGILFDDYNSLPDGVSQDIYQEHIERIRKDKLSQFWESLVRADAEKHAQKAKLPEEKAIAYLSGHNVIDACSALIDRLDLRLATMVAQIGGDEAMRLDVADQIDDWRKMDVLSEMTDEIRALYELLAGNCDICEGRTGGGLENKASTFKIASRFGLDWRRAFGLRLWYGTMVHEPIHVAIAQFADALRDGKEEAKPVPWFVEQGVDMGWKDPEPENREDILWGILKLYASSKLELPANVEDILSPENVSGHPLNARLAWQFFQHFRARQQEAHDSRKIGLPTARSGNGLNESLLSSITSSTEKDRQAEDPLTALGDNLTLLYASSLHSPQHWTTAVFVYTHLSSPVARAHYIRTLLALYSDTYEISEEDTDYQYLTKTLRIHKTWIYAAAALRAKAEGDDVQQTLHLLKADELAEAHEVLCRSVGPSSIISRDYDTLREVLGDFIPSPENSPAGDLSRSRGRPRARKDPVQGWSHGGQIYFDYIHLLDLTSQQSRFSWQENEVAGLNQEISFLLNYIQERLEVVGADRWETRSLEERVALTEISSEVARLMGEIQSLDKAQILKLPLAEDGWLKHSRELSTLYHRAALMAAK
ncbi:hypothetical protein GQ43DRAFT_468968 [Delitschia confertaspora ATCC 74209]|uniref:Peptidase S59 domain-containing protein n=1 Tax=Delitschia confertaspora ATCC 74209 TaxID=1513339 RepID=A0A9P4MSV1_9PLEO|nr:hypothetical protein GQ43DRAFT_468968 [Delitschia confertaspora ATCC 74209]